ncbi:MBL fold metallo-hydrolase [Patescibacteria group bacterium]|nr:MBL fold metallo-hydrolase [Patescibacteria group bacterium]
MKIHTLSVGQLRTNCYLIEDGGEVGIVDPGDDGDYILRKINDIKAKAVWMIATHGHFDHVLGVCEIVLALKIPFYLSSKDIFLLEKAKKSAEYFIKARVDPILAKPQPVKDGLGFLIGKSKFRVIETPGHTPGGISLYCQTGKVLFCGDLVFARGAVGRTDFEYASSEDLAKSIKKILKLPDKTVVYPGHGENTTIGDIKKEPN